MKKYYDQENNRFIIKDDDWKERTYKTFKGFAKALNKDLSDADLRGYTFEGISLKDYIYEDADIDIEVLHKQGLYDDTFYNSIIDSSSEVHLEMMCTEELGVAVADKSVFIETSSLVDEYRPLLNGDPLRWRRCFFNSEYHVGYISDIHIDVNIKNRFPVAATRRDIERYVGEIIDEMLVDSFQDLDYLIVCGDVASSFVLTELFYRTLALRDRRAKVIGVLGNHELWNVPGKNTFEQIAKKYEDELGTDGRVTLLQNALYVRRVENQQEYSKVFSEEQLLAMSVNELKSLRKNARIMIFGSLGFSKYNLSFNASSGIYKDVISSEEEERQSERVGLLHKKVGETLSGQPLIFVTHMPMRNWIEEENYLPKWTYLWGHTHKNELEFSNERKVFADNQVGYNPLPATIKAFRVSQLYDTFEEYSDGIYEITVEAYRDYYIGINIEMKFEASDVKTLFLLRKSNYNMFLMRSEKTGRILFLSGGQRRKLVEQSLERIYSQLDIYAVSLDNRIKDFKTSLRKLSKEVISIGGTGRIHGCIVDINQFSHLFLNPLNGNIFAYMAENIVSKIGFENPLSLIHCLYRSGSIRGPKNGKDTVELGLPKNSLILQSGTYISTNAVPVSETWHYQLSRRVLDIGRIGTHHTIRVWDEELVNQLPNRDLEVNILDAVLIED